MTCRSEKVKHLPTIDWASLRHLTTKLHHSSVTEAACRLRNTFDHSLAGFGQQILCNER